MKYAATALFLTLLAAGGAQAASFVAEVKGDTVTVYSTSDKLEHCQIHNKFSYVVKGERFTTTQECNVDVEKGKHLDVCHVKHSDINEAKIEAPVEVVSCKARAAAAPAPAPSSK